MSEWAEAASATGAWSSSTATGSWTEEADTVVYWAGGLGDFMLDEDYLA